MEASGGCGHQVALLASREAPEVAARGGPPDRLCHLILAGNPEGCLEELQLPYPPGRRVTLPQEAPDPLPTIQGSSLIPARKRLRGSQGREGADSEPAPLAGLEQGQRLHDTWERWHLWAAGAPPETLLPSPPACDPGKLRAPQGHMRSPRLEPHSLSREPREGQTAAPSHTAWQSSRRESDQGLGCPDKQHQRV